MKPTAVPRQFVKDPEKVSERSIRAAKRQKTSVCSSETTSTCLDYPANDAPDFGLEVEISDEQTTDACLLTNTVSNCSSEQATAVTKNSSTQCDSRPRLFSIHNYSKPQDNDNVSYYTGFEDYSHFMYFFNILGPAVDYLIGLENIPLPPEDQLFLTLMKLRQSKDDFELSGFFNLREPQVSVVFTTWVNFMYFQLSEIDIWPTRSAVDAHMPSNFKKVFPTTRVILDATEVPIQKPSACGPQRATFSTYKNKNTLKVIVGCTPKGAVSFVSDAYGGSASDRQIVERSELIRNKSMFERYDSIMADRGIMVQDLFAGKDVYVNTPTMLKGKSQLEPEEVHRDRKVASKRIHVERIIGLAKTYKILNGINSNWMTLGNRIIKVCFLLCNFRRSIVKKHA